MVGKTVDLFCGCGGFSLGAELAGFRSLAAIDIEQNLQSAYLQNFRNSNAVIADLSEIEASDWHHLIGTDRPDGVIGGPPCQGFSFIGKRDKADPRNTLIGHFFRHVAALRPKFFVMENVEGLLSEENQEFLARSMSNIPGSYDVLGPLCLKAPAFGAPTRRRRIAIVGYDRTELGTFQESDFLGKEDRQFTTVREAISDLPAPITQSKDRTSMHWSAYPKSSPGQLSSYARLMRSPPPKSLASNLAREMFDKGQVSGLAETRHSKEIADRYRGIDGGKIDPITKSYKLEWDGICPTLRAGTGSEKGSFQAVRPLHPDEGRVITVREAARLQGFPDWFTFHPTKWHSFRMIGNSVSPLVSHGVLSAFSERLSLRKAA